MLSKSTIRTLCLQASATAEQCAIKADQARSANEWEHYFHAWQRFGVKAQIYKELYYLIPHWS